MDLFRLYKKGCKMKTLIIAGKVKDVKAIINSLIERYGKDTKVIELIKKFNKESLVFV